MRDHKQSLEPKIRLLSERIASFQATADMQELLRLIHQPGWTTVAEGLLVESLIDTMTQQIQTLQNTRMALMRAAAEVRG